MKKIGGSEDVEISDQLLKSYFIHIFLDYVSHYIEGNNVSDIVDW